MVREITFLLCGALCGVVGVLGAKATYDPSSAPTTTHAPSNTYKPSAQPTPLPTGQPTPIPTPVPTSVPTVSIECSSKLCSELSWPAGPWGSAVVCGASDEAPLVGCSGQVGCLRSLSPFLSPVSTVPLKSCGWWWPSALLTFVFSFELRCPTPRLGNYAKASARGCARRKNS